MRKLLSFVFAISFTLSTFADEYRAMWSTVENHLSKDMPKKAMASLNEIAKKAKSEQNYGEYLAARLKYARVEAEVTPDSIIPAIKSLIYQAADAKRVAEAPSATDNDKVLSAVYHAILAKLYDTYINTGADTLVQQVLISDSISFTNVPDMLYDVALSNPDVLAACPYTSYNRLASKGSDDVIFNNDMLSLIGREAMRWGFLRDYYLSKNNLRAAAIVEYARVSRHFDSNNDRAVSIRKKQLVEDMDVYKSVPEGVLFAKEYYDLLEDDDDITDSSRYLFLTQKIEQYEDMCNKADKMGYVNSLKMARTRLINPKLYADVKDDNICLDILNISKVDIEVAYLNGIDGTNKLSCGNTKDLEKLKKIAEKDKNPFRTSLSYTNPIYENHVDTVRFPHLAPGVYLVSVKAGKLSNYALFYHSDLSILSLAISDKIPETEKESGSYPTRLAVVYSSTGQPVPGAKINISQDSYGKAEKEITLTTDDKGIALFDGSFRASHLRAYTEKDHPTPDNAFRKVIFGGYMSVYNNKKDRDILSLFIDRAIYRPGQTVKGAVVVHNSAKEDSIHIKQNKRVIVTFTNNDGTKIHTDTIYTDGHGNAGFEYTLPKSGKNGTFHVSCSAAYSTGVDISFRVEDYKRPTFTVEALDTKKFEDPIEIKEVIDPDKKESMFIPGYTSATDSVVTVRFQAKTYSQLPVQNASVTYSVNRSNSYYRWASSEGYRPIIPDSLVQTDDKGIVSISFPLTLPEEANGYYHFKVHASITDEAGETHEADMTVVAHKVYVKKDGKPVKEEKEKTVRKTNESEFRTSAYSFPADGSVTFTMRRLKPTEHPTKAYLGQAYAFYTIYNDKEVIESGTLSFDTLYTRRFEYRKEYGEALNIAYAWIMDGQSHTYVTSIRKPKPDLELNTTWTSFRDRTQPGSKETWTLHVTSSDKKTPVPTASLIATIYDKSLDAIVGRSPSFSTSVLCNYYHFNTVWVSNFQSGTSLSCVGSWSYLRTSTPLLPSFRDDIFPYRSFYSKYNRSKYVRIRGRARALETSMPEPMMVAEAKSLDAMDESGALQEVVVVGYGTMKAAQANGSHKREQDSEEDDDEDEYEENESGQGAPKENLSQMVRTNFNETAYFTPSLSADENGDINIAFELPEAMTTWQLKGFVHDDIMRNDLVSAECIAKKDVIVRPNIPRYLREGDRGNLEATVFNTTSADLQTEVIMQFVEPETETVIWEKKQNVTLKAEGSEAVSFTMSEIPGDTLLIYRIVARAKNGNSDGEQHFIPILPAVENLTTTYAFTQHGTGTLTKDFANLLYADSRNRKLTVKYAPHAVDFLIDAVPSIIEVKSHNAMDLATAVYVGNMFHDAASRISGRNDSARIDSLITAATNELRELQLHDGAWTWWKGMHGSVYMTVEISKLLARLNYHGFANAQTNKMLSKAMPYMLKYMKEEAKEIRKYLKKNPKEKIHPSETTTNILYINALLRLNPENYAKGGASAFKKNDTKDIKFLVDLLEKVPTEFTIYGKAHSASVLSLYGKKKKAQEFIESMKEYSVCTEEAGRYYDSPRAYYSWRNHRIPTEVAAIEALRLVTPSDSITVEEMQKWLLHEKRTQQWDNSANTADAIYAFILDNSEIEYIKEDNTIKSTHSLTDYADNRFSLDGRDLEMTGTKVQTSTLPIGNEHVFSVDKTSKGTAWGSLFFEQQAPLKSIKSTGTGFSVTRNIVEDNIKVGDKITVRITIVADRDYDFVEVVDNRAACLEPVQQLSGYQHAITGGTARGSYSGYYRETRDNKTNYYFDRLSKGTHVIETDYYVDRHGSYQQGTCNVKCVYAPEFSAILSPTTINIK